MDGIFGIGPLELILIAIIALIVLGPERLPSVMREAARYIREIRKLGNELTSQFGDELKGLDDLNPRKIINDALDPNRAEPPKPAAPAAPAKPVQPVQPVQPPVVQAAQVALPDQNTGAQGSDPGSATAGNGAAHTPAAEPVYSILPPTPPAEVAQAEVAQAEVAQAEALVTKSLAAAASSAANAPPTAASVPPETPA